MTPENAKKPASSRFRFQEAGLLWVIFVLGVILTWQGGTVKVPVFEIGPDGERQRVFDVGTDGERTPRFEEKNKFLNTQNLAQLLKDTSFIAIMAVGATFIIIAGGIDLSVGSIYALASVTAALVLRSYGPDGANAAASPWLSVPLGIVTCLGVATFCGLLNGGMITLLRVHPFIITLGTMAIFRGIAFVMTKGQSIGGFPEPFRN
ncbi:MAG: rbsC 1, partial [Verrucomicrobia bacterium]|nr:rbsC 1 [Verrucomicrobiota bacterium]